MAGDQGIDGGFRRILDAISDGIYVTAPDRTVVYWSEGAERITGYSADEIVGRRCDEEVLGHTDLHGTRLCGVAPLLWTVEGYDVVASC
mgnify:CR=1 FL=1